MRSEKMQIQHRVSQAFEVTIDPHVVLAVNETQYYSEVAGELAKDTRYPFGACFFVRGDGLKIWSLRSDRSLGDFDCECSSQVERWWWPPERSQLQGISPSAQYYYVSPVDALYQTSKNLGVKYLEVCDVTEG